ncbi:MAG: class I SAM-dependent methyltransferase [Candidatus Dormibacteraceae bacterium]
MSDAAEGVDWAGWLRRWEAQQGGFLPHREERFEAVIEVARALVGPAPLAVDLGCGPGSLAARILDRLPRAHVVAVDGDPLLLELGRRAIGEKEGRIRWVDADLRDPDWISKLGLHGQIDAAMSTTALHWISPEETVRLCQALATLIRPGGIFVNGDHMSFDADQPCLAAVASMPPEPGPAGAAEGWDQWWQAVEAEPGLADLAAARRARWGGHPDHHSAGEASFWRATLLRAGFSEAGFAWQRLDDRVLVAVR